MRFLADENFPGDAVIALEHEEYDIVWIRAAAPGIDDKTILAWAMQDSRILLTFDKDFGELARSAGLPATCGGIFVSVIDAVFGWSRRRARQNDH